jgi:hypothetical protein
MRANPEVSLETRVPAETGPGVSLTPVGAGGYFRNPNEVIRRSETRKT